MSVSLSKHNSENFSDFTPKKPKMESDLDVEENYNYPSKAKNIETGDEISIPLSAILRSQQNQNANEGLMAPPPRAKQAIAAMSAIGFSSRVSGPVLRRLLKLYDNNYNYIEENGYQVLIDSILEEQKKAAGVKTKNCVADDNCKQSRKRVISSHEMSVSLSKHNSENFSDFTPKKPKMESDLDVEENYNYPSKAKNIETGDEISIPLSAILRSQQNQNANEGLSDHRNQVDSSSRSTPVLEANNNAPLATQSTAPHLDAVSGKKVAANTSLGNGNASEFVTSRKSSSATLEVASSDRENVKVLLSVNSNIVMPRLDRVIKVMEERYLKCYMLSDPEFSLKKILRDMCQCASELSPETINSEQENAVKHSFNEERKETQEKDENDEEGEENKEQKKINCSSHSLQVLKAYIKPRHDQEDISKGKERVRISFVNEFSNEDAPPPFYYIPKNILYQNAYVNFSLARVGDEGCCSDCFGDCESAPIPCLCARETGGEFAYTNDGLLKPTFLDGCMSINSKPQKHHHVYCQDCPLERSKKSKVSNKCKGHIVRKFIKECWSKCGCSKQCTNRVVQHGISRSLQVFSTPEGKGWGLRTLEELPRGAFVCEYVGEILTNMELHDRAIQSMANAEHTYPVHLDADWGSERPLKDDEALCLDATFYGNVARFVNHRCVDANMVEIPVEIETPDRHYYHLAFFTTRKVEPYEELTWDYGIDFNDVDYPIKAFKCGCGSKFCRDTKWSKVELVEPNKNCSEIPGSSMLPIPLTVVEKEATQPNRIHDDIPGSSLDTILSTVADMEPTEQNKTCAEIPVRTSDLLPSSVEAETIEPNEKCSEIPKSTSDLITSSVEVEHNEQNKMCNTNLGLTSDIVPSIEAEATELDKMVDEFPRSISDNLPSSVVEKEPTEPKRKSGDICGSTSVSTFDTLPTVSSFRATETPETDPNIDPSKAHTPNLGSKTDSVPSSIVEEELTKTNRTCAETSGSMLGLACNNTTIISFDGHVGSPVEAREIVVSNKANETHVETTAIVLSATDIGISLEKVVPSKTTENEIVAERLTIGIAAVESIEPHGNSTEILAPKSVPLTKENEIIAFESVDVVLEYPDPSSCPMKNLDISKETEGEKTVCGSEIRSTLLQTEEKLPSTMHLETHFCTASSNMASVHETYSLPNVGSSQVELTVDDYPFTENGLANSPQLLRIEGEHTVDTILNMLNASAVKSDELAMQTILPLPPSSEAEEARSSSNSHGESTAQQLTVQESLQAHQSNQLNSQPILHAPPSFETAGISNSHSVLPVQRPIWNESVHANQSYLSGFQSAELLPSPSATLLPERIQTEGNTGTSVSQDPENRGFHSIPIAFLIHPQALHPNILQNELTGIHKQIEIRTKMHEYKKFQLKLECEQELEKVRKKYDALIQEGESGFNQDKNFLETIYSKLLINRILAEEFRSKFMNSKPETSAFAQGYPAGPTPAGLVHSTPSVVPTIPNIQSPFSARANNQCEGEARTPSPGAPAPRLRRFRPSTLLSTAPTISSLVRHDSCTPNPGADI